MLTVNNQLCIVVWVNCIVLDDHFSVASCFATMSAVATGYLRGGVLIPTTML